MEIEFLKYDFSRARPLVLFAAPIDARRSSI